MKKYLLLSLLVISNFLLSGQEISLNESNSFYEYSHIKESNDKELLNRFKNRLTDLNYKEIVVQENSISGQGFTNHLVGGFATVEIRYVIKISFKEGRYKLTLTNFVLTDKNGSDPLEGMGSFKKKWIRIINEKLPMIIDNVETLKNTNDW